MEQLLAVSEIFFSIQGESTYGGRPCIFIRLAGCNLRCDWCDTEYAQEGDRGRESSVDEIVATIGAYPCNLVEITGGEPLLQEGTLPLLKRLLAKGYQLLMETNGTIDLRPVDRRVTKVVDVKCPSSGHADAFHMENLSCLTSRDEVKFVITGREDYDFAKDFIKRHLAGTASPVLFSPASPAMEPRELAQWILDDGLPVRLQLQLHRFIWGEARGV